MSFPVQKTDAEWRELLAKKGAEPRAFEVTRQASTERPYSGKYEQVWADGSYHCICCGNTLFDASTKFDAGCGWPSFSQAVPGAITEITDRSHGMVRVETVCSQCGAHLGHVFPRRPHAHGPALLHELRLSGAPTQPRTRHESQTASSRPSAARLTCACSGCSAGASQSGVDQVRAQQPRRAPSRTASPWRWWKTPRNAPARCKPGGTIVEPTSGNTGIGLAMVAAVKGYKLILVMPDSMSVERRRLMLAYGASFDLTPREKGMKGSIARAEEIVASTPGAWMPQQFNNPANVDVHVRTTAEEIAADFPEGIDAIITGVGTGGHITGVARVLKARWPQLQGVRRGALRPHPSSPAARPRPTPSRALARASSPTTSTRSVLDGVILVDAEAAREMARRSAREEGMLVGISSGRHTGRHCPKAARAGRPTLWCSASITTPANATLSVEGFLPA